MSIKINLGKWSSVFAIPTSVVDENIKIANEKQLKVLLYVLRHSNEEITEESVARDLEYNAGDVQDYIEFWRETGVLSFDDKPHSTAGHTFAADDGKGTKTPRPLTRAQKPDSVFVAQRLKNDSELSSLIEEVQMVLGKPLSSGDTATLVMLHETDGLPCDVLLMLVNYCHSMGKDNMRYIEKVAVGWAAEDITTLERAEKKIEEMVTYGEAWNTVAGIFGISNTGSPTKAQKENANRWINQWHFSEELLREAYERCVNKKNTFNITYTNGILKNWKKYNINSLKELKEFEEKKGTSSKPAKNNGLQASYDIEKYEEFSMFD